MALPQELPSHQALTSNELAGLRTVMAADRTLMAWVRTSLSLLSFGFTIYKILREFDADKDINVKVTPETAGLFLAGMGTLAMVMGTVDYWHTLRELNQDARFSFRRPQLVMATVMTLVGVGLFVGIAAHVV